MKKDILIKALLIVLILFGLFILYQIVKKIIGGSWTADAIAISLLIANTGIIISTQIKLTKVKSNLNHLSNKFDALAKDFKNHIKESQTKI